MAVDVGNPSTKCKVYRRRWLMLALFVLCSITSYMQWIQYSIIGDSIAEFYGVSYEAVNWTSMVFLVAFIPCIFPGVYLVNSLGIRTSLLLATFATCAAAWIKVGGVAQDRFWVYMLGQFIVAIFEVIIVALPVPVASAWFGEDQISTACGIGIFGLQLGIAIGFIVPPMLVHNNGIVEVLEHDLYVLTISTALFCTVILTISYLAFEDEPPEPPSLARKNTKETGKLDFFASLRRIIKMRSYMILVVAYGLNVGVFYGISTLLNQILVTYYPEAAADAGRIGLLLVVSGMAGSIIFGIAMDKFHKFKETTFAVFIGCLLSMLLFSFTLTQGIPVLYAVAVVFGFFTSGILPVGFEVAAELTYPEPDAICTGLVGIIAQATAVVFIYVYSYLFYNVGALCANLTTSGIFLISNIMLFFMKFDLKRRRAQNEVPTVASPEISVISR